jgi:hypothetical protein
MSYAKYGTSNLPVSAKIQYLRRLSEATTGNPNFPNPTPTPAELSNQADALEIAYNEAQAARLISKSKTTVQDEQDALADALVAQLASYVDNASGGDPVKIESAGFEVRATPTPVGELPPPTDVQVKPSEHAGSADVSWQTPRGAKSNLIERATDAPTLNWAVIGATTKSKATLNSMVSGTKYWFRVASVGAAGQSAWSDPVPLFAP